MLVEKLHALRLHLAGIEDFFVVFPPIVHITLFWIVLGGFPVVHLHEVPNLDVTVYPKLVLRHNYFISLEK